MTGVPRSGWRPGSTEPEVVRSPGVRVVLDIRPLQDPERAPLTAAYLEGLVGALADDPQPGESILLVQAADQDDPSSHWPGLAIAGRRLVPPTRLLKTGALTVDPVLLRGATLGAGWHAERGGASGSVYHAAAGALPIASGIPTIAALLDLAPWQLPAAYQRGRVARFGQRIRGRLLQEAAAVIVPSVATEADAHRLLRIRASRLRVVPLAARPAYRPEAAIGGRDEATRLGLGERYAVYAGRYDARQDLPTLFAALSALAAEAGPDGGAEWPPRVCLVGASPDDRAAVSRAAGRAGVSDLLAYAPLLPGERMAGLVAGARFLVQPVRSEAAGLAALDALAAGVPVIATSVGALPETIGAAGIFVEPGDAARLATAIRAAWCDDELHATLVAATLSRPARTRTWADVARETRAIWAEAARPAPLL